jgi:hypothetical protein
VGLHIAVLLIHGRIIVATLVLCGVVVLLIQIYAGIQRGHICPSYDMEFISTLLTIFRNNCCCDVLIIIMSGNGDLSADGQFKDKGQRKVIALLEKVEMNVIPAGDKGLL